MNSILTDFVVDTCKSLDNLRKSGVCSEFVCDFRCEELKDYLNFDIRDSVQFHELFQKLIKIKGPVLYWYEITSDQSNDVIINALRTYKLSGQRITPTIYKNYDKRTRILYVGKCKECFWGRVIQHLGYHTADTTQGLQLYHWAKDLRLDVRLHALEFADDMKDIMPIVESYFAKRLCPLVGKHI